MTTPVVGKGIERVDARLKATGRATYAAETAIANVAHAVIVTSTIARGSIVSIDTGAALRVPGVLVVMTHANAPRVAGNKKATPQDKVLSLLQDDQVLYNDQPIAVVVADTLERAQEAAAVVVVKYAEQPAAFAIEPEMPRAYAPEKAGPTGSTDSARGDVKQGLARAFARVDETYTTPVQHHNPMEMHATIAVWQGADRLVLYETTQGVFGVRKRMAALFGLEPASVRIISHYVGGGFGCKGSTWAHEALAAMAARMVGRGVKLVLTRQQMFAQVGNRPRTVQRVSLGADRDGKLTAIRHDVISETSRFDEFVEPAAKPARMLYACPNVVTSHRLVRLDIPTPTFMRAPGESSGSFALESAMDELAYALKLDPLQLRLRNYAERDLDEDKPWSSKVLRECYRQGAERFGWARRRHEPRAMRDGRWLVGLGMATATYPARQSASSAVARLRRDGTLLVQAGTQDIGTGTYTIMTQIAADAVALPLEQVRFELGDTAFPETPVSGGSQTAASTGSAVKRAGLELRAKLVELSRAHPESPLSGLAPDGIDAAGGALFSKHHPDKRDSYAAIVARSGQPEIVVQVENKSPEDRKKYSTHSFGAQFVEVRVDEDLGEVRVARCVGAFGAGKILNARTGRSQFQGGIVWGIGFALEEHTVRDHRTGRAVTRDLADYHVPVHADVPDIDVIMVDEDDPHVSGVGAKGIGEIGITGVVAAIANAVFHATGKRVRELPITLDKLLV
ncbi:MAG TPA: xanthine dehydrogenase family protein molybdopterin-binding subunit [Polyangia bacterium]|nr:xanthine dehydrogenase family protein molybdopterin-binding subunit [Polyangia bacterium]